VRTTVTRGGRRATGKPALLAPNSSAAAIARSTRAATNSSSEAADSSSGERLGSSSARRRHSSSAGAAVPGTPEVRRIFSTRPRRIYSALVPRLAVEP